MSPAPSARPRAGTLVLVLLVAIATVAVQHRWLNEPEYPTADALRYLALSYGIARHGTFSEALPGQAAPGPEMRYMPLYPAFVAGLQRLDPVLARNIECVLAHPTAPAEAGCEARYDTLVQIQLALVALTMMGVWLLAWCLSGSALVAWLAFAAAALARWQLEFANQFLLEVPILFLASWTSVALALLAQTGARRWIVLAAAGLAVLTLIKSVYLYVALGLVAVWLAATLLTRRDRLRTGLGRAALGALVFALLLAPWLARNAAVLGQPALSAGYGGNILAQRVAYNDMTAAEWATAFLFWFPDTGDSLARRLVDERHHERLKRVGERSFYVVGNGRVMRETMARAEAEGLSHQSYLLREEVLVNLPKHLVVTVPLAWRAMFIAKWWGVLAVICLAVVAVRMVRERREDFALVSALPLIVLALHALVSVSLPRYNLVLLPLYATVLGIAFAGLWRRLTRSRQADPAPA